MKKIVSLIMFLLPLTLLGQPGSIDRSFAENGMSSVDIGITEAVALQSDGKILLACQEINTDKLTKTVCLVRYTAEGKPDNTFANFGKGVCWKFGIEKNSLNGMLVQRDDKILLYGDMNDGEQHDGFILRLMPDGKSRDASFGNDGFVFINLSKTDWITAMALDPDGKIIFAGYVDLNNKFDLLVGRLNTDGSINRSFGKQGFYRYDEDTLQYTASAIALQNDGKIIIGGQLKEKAYVSRLLANGELDKTFNLTGMNILASENVKDNTWFNSLQVGSDGKIWAAGEIRLKTPGNWLIARFNPDGSLDQSYANKGKYICAPSKISNSVYDCLLTPDGKLLVAGTEFACFSSTGFFDYSFGKEGIAKLDNLDNTKSIALTKDNKIIIGATSLNNERRSINTLLRLNRE